MLWSTARRAPNLKRTCSIAGPHAGLPGKISLHEHAGGGVIQIRRPAPRCAPCWPRANVQPNSPATAKAAMDASLPICSTQLTPHQKGMKIVGMGSDNLRQIGSGQRTSPCVPKHCRPDRIRHQGRSDSLLRLRTVGTTSSNATIPSRIAHICRDHNLWLHVGCCHEGTAALCPEFRFIHDGVEFADSYCFTRTNGCSRTSIATSLRRRPEALNPNALRFAGVPAQPGNGSGAVIDYRDWHIQLGTPLFVRSNFVRESGITAGSKACSTTSASTAPGPAFAAVGARTIRASNAPPVHSTSELRRMRLLRVCATDRRGPGSYGPGSALNSMGLAAATSRTHTKLEHRR